MVRDMSAIQIEWSQLHIVNLTYRKETVASGTVYELASSISLICIYFDFNQA